MYTAKQVDNFISDWKGAALSKPELVVKAANACIGWAYVFGARGEYCSPANRRRFYASKGKATIKSKCSNFEGSGYSGCTGCKWYPGGATRFFDCRGFTYWLFNLVDIKIAGVGATSQYNDDTNWEVKGPIEQMPKDKVCCVFRYDASKGTMEHTLLYDGNGYYIHCSGEVKKTKMSSYKATHFAIPKGLYSAGEVVIVPAEPVTSQPSNTTEKLPMLKRGSKGPYVAKLQTMLMNRGYQLPKYGADADFGKETFAAVLQFQKDNGLIADGIVGPKTWEVLEKNVDSSKLYTVHIPFLTEDKANALIGQYSGSWKTIEE